MANMTALKIVDALRPITLQALPWSIHWSLLALAIITAVLLAFSLIPWWGWVIICLTAAPYFALCIIVEMIGRGGA